MIEELHRFCRCAARTAQRMAGVPDYEAYLRHRRTTHPDEPVMSYEVFYRERQQARYTPSKGKFSGGCC